MIASTLLPERSSALGVQGFPTLKWFSRGKPTSAPDECASHVLFKADAFQGLCSLMPAAAHVAASCCLMHEQRSMHGRR